MRDDQYLRLQALEEKLTEEVLREADPESWTAPGVAAKDLSQQQRGDRYWCKKNAVAVISLTIRVGSLIGMVQRAGPSNPEKPEGEGSTDNLLDDEIRDAENQAKKFLKEMAGAKA